MHELLGTKCTRLQLLQHFTVGVCLDMSSDLESLKPLKAAEREST